jgi:hypothetical protein
MMDDYPTLPQIEKAHGILTPLMMGPILGFCGRVRDNNFELRIDVDTSEWDVFTERQSRFYFIAPDGEIVGSASTRDLAPL